MLGTCSKANLWGCAVCFNHKKRISEGEKEEESFDYCCLAKQKIVQLEACPI